MNRKKLSIISSTAVAGLSYLAPRVAFASHMSGGENDLMGLYGGIALVLGFGGLLAILGLVPKRWRKPARRWGKWLMVAGVTVLLVGGYQVSRLGRAEETLGGDAYGRMAVQQIVGTLAVFISFWGGVYYLAKRAGVLDMGERVKYSVLRNGDPADATATRVARPGEQRLMFIPFIAMGLLALFFAGGVLIVLYRLSAKA
ncbi:MAG TPA: hypothetical protein VK464_26415 [Symbiobacteriaceae bacterium]|jgi:prepilin signal peptidase PulO-like enzyme (type II secretory pathway)|nr:hypothetical protein [Symbiobacteriaceae bacterium]